ncbi:MAG: hypothetical protein JNL10_11710 [Verrucomicrobiales bacterium]|nr:hypothetical protein [Verrucomicrobiales bacterium]
MAIRSPQLLPAVLLRELRAAARRRGTYWLRTTIAAAALLTLFLHGVGDNVASTLGRGSTLNPGAGVFALLHTVLSLVLLLAAPMIAADTISRERREGTLPLLGLTPLRPIEIVLGKAAAQILRLIPLWLACVPVLIIPVLAGGVAPRDLEIALGVEWIILATGLASGLVSTSVCRQWTQSAGLAFAMTLAAGGLMAVTAGSALLQSPGAKASLMQTARWQGSVWTVSIDILSIGSGVPFGGFGNGLASMPPATQSTLMWMLLAGVIGTLPLSAAAIAFAGWRVEALLRPKSHDEQRRRPSSGSVRTSATWLDRVREKQRLKWLQGNPARWLWAKAGPGYWARGAWVAVVASLWMGTLVLSPDSEAWTIIPRSIPLALSIPMAMSAAASLRREMEEGTLELLLVTPLEAARLVSARVVEAWSLFIPAISLNLLLLAVQSPRTDPSYPLMFAILLAGTTSLAAIPAIGIRYAVRRLHPLAGMIWSLLTAGILPFLIGLATLAWCSSGPPFPGVSEDRSAACWFGLGFGLTQGTLACVWGWLASRDLELRWYNFRPFQTRPR